MVGWIKFVTMFLSALSLVLLIYQLHTSNIPGSGLDYDYTDLKFGIEIVTSFVNTSHVD